jgi:hypothetical protein
MMRREGLALRRYFLSSFTTSEDPDLGIVRTPIVATLGEGSFSFVDGGATFLATVAADSMAPFLGVDGVDPLPGVPLSCPIQDIPQADLDSLLAALVRRGIQVDLSGAPTFGAIVDRVGKAINPIFDISRFYVSESE